MNTLKIIGYVVFGCVCLGPTLNLLAFGYLFGLSQIFISWSEFVNFIIACVIPTYAIYCLLWLAFNQTRVTIKSIPTAIWFGFAVGHIIMVAALVVILKSGGLLGLLLLSWVLGFGPAVFSWYLLTRIYWRSKKAMTAN